MKLIDKSALVAEIERLKDIQSSPIALCNDLISFIDSQSEEPVSEDLEEAIKAHKKELDYWGMPCGYKDASCNGFKAGAKWQKRKMMKDIVLETKVVKDGDGDGIEYPFQEWLTLEQTEITSIPDHIGLQEGDKVKIIIIKED